LPNNKAKILSFLKGAQRKEGVMKKCMITITEVLDNEPCQTMVLDIIDDTISVNCPENSGIKVESVNRGLHFELIFKLPNLEHELHFQCKNNQTSDVLSEGECAPTIAACTDAHLVHHLQVAA
jgi:hypothetical protein